MRNVRITPVVKYEGKSLLGVLRHILEDNVKRNLKLRVWIWIYFYGRVRWLVVVTRIMDTYSIKEGGLLR